MVCKDEFARRRRNERKKKLLIQAIGKIRGSDGIHDAGTCPYTLLTEAAYCFASFDNSERNVRLGIKIILIF